MKVVIKDSHTQGSLWAAHRIASKIRAKSEKTDEPFVIGLCTGSTPIETYAELVRMHREEGLSFKNVISFNMDEYVGLPREHGESYYTFMHENFFNHIDIKEENTHMLNGNAGDLERECREYEDAMVKAGGVDLFLGGVGEDGHLAFNEPFSSFESRTRVVTLTEDTILVNSRFFDNDVTKVPKQAVSVGIATVMAAGEVIILGFGPKKAKAIKSAIEGPMSSSVPLSAIQGHPNGIIVLDEASAGELRVNSYRYFKALEKAETGRG